MLHRITQKYNASNTEWPYIIVTAATFNYLDYLYAFLTSLGIYFSKKLEVIIIHNGLDHKVYTTIKRLLPNHINISLYDIRNFCSQAIKFNWTNPIYWRLIAPHLVESNTSLVYMDADIIVRKDFSELFSQNLEGKTAGACIDYLKEIRHGVNNYQELGLDPTKLYFNAGMLLIDVARYKERHILEHSDNILSKNVDYLVAYGKWPQYDQYALNVALYDDWVLLPKIYNYGSEFLFSDKAKLVHFIGNGKPGTPTCSKQYTHEFYSFLYKSNTKS